VVIPYVIEDKASIREVLTGADFFFDGYILRNGLRLRDWLAVFDKPLDMHFNSFFHVLFHFIPAGRAIYLKPDGSRCIQAFEMATSRGSPRAKRAGWFASPRERLTVRAHPPKV
jgi:hypothetical protein